MPLFLVPTILVLKHRHKRREWEHLERMKAMERPACRSRSGRLGRLGGRRGDRGRRSDGSRPRGVPDERSSGEPTTLDEVPVPAVAWGCAVLISAGGLVTSLSWRHAGAGAAESRFNRLGRLDAPSRPSTRTRSTWWGAGAEPMPCATASHRVSPAAPQIAISGSSGMWNRAETIVRAWKTAIAAAVAIVGISRRRDAGPARTSPADRQDGQPEVRQPIGQYPRLGVRLVEEDEVAEPAQAEPGYRHGSAAEVGQRPTEQDARPLRLRDRAQRAIVGLVSAISSR